MPKVVRAKGKKAKEFPYTPAGEAAAEKLARETGGKLKMEKGYKRKK